MENITSFKDDYSFLSNFHKSTFRWRGVLWKTVEHAYQAAKAIDDEHFELIRNADSAKDATKLGKIIPMRKDFDDIKLSLMRELLTLKFENIFLKFKLLETGEALLIEDNCWRDTFWGVYKGVGENHLGKLLMEIRKELKNSNDM